MYLTSITNTAELDRLIDESLHYKLTEEDIAEMLAEEKAEGIAEGKAEGIAEATVDLAFRMINEGCSTDLISRVTGYSIAEVEKMRAEQAQ